MEPYLQRTLFHHPHCIDYIALLVAKRIAIGSDIDREGWRDASYELIERHLPLNHHHEIVWLVWLLLAAKLDITEQLAAALSQNGNAHIRALVVAAYVETLIARKPPIRLGGRLATTDEHWLLNLVARAKGYSGATFSGSLSAEFQHLADKRVNLIDFESHMRSMRKVSTKAISLSRYGYDGDEDDGGDYEDDDDDREEW